MPPDTIYILKEEESLERVNENENSIALIKKRANDEGHYYYYWMRNHPSDIELFEKSYTDSYKLKYKGMIEAIKGNRIRQIDANY